MSTLWRGVKGGRPPVSRLGASASDQNVSRLQWVDAARGACVIAVVVFHVGLGLYAPFAADIWKPAERGWWAVDGLLASLRMPLLLAISGMLSSRRIREGWGRPGAAVRAGSTYYLYVVWLTVHYLLYLVVGTPKLQARIGYLPSFGLELVAPTSTFLWYIYALALYTALLTTVRKVPPWIVISVLASLSVVIWTLEPGTGQWEKVLYNTVFFAVGVYGGPRLVAFVQRRRIVDLVVCACTAVVLVGLGLLNLGSFVTGLIFVVRGCLFILLGAALVAALVQVSFFARSLEFIGRRTLQIYVLHIPLIAIAAEFLARDRARALLQNPLIAVAWPVAVSALMITLSLLLRRLLVMAKLNVLFQMPAAWVRAIERRYTTSHLPSVESGRHRSDRKSLPQPADRAIDPGSV